MEQVTPAVVVPLDPLTQMNKYRALVATVGAAPETNTKESEKLQAVQELLDNLEVINYD